MAKLPYKAVCGIPAETLAMHRAYSHGLGLPEVGDRPVAAQLLVIGNAPTIGKYVDVFRAWDGDIWAINGAFDWCMANGIDAALYCVDPVYMTDKAARAVLADTCQPALFDAVPDVTLARIGEGNISHWCTAASTAPMIAAECGYHHVTFYGVDSSFTNRTHAHEFLPTTDSRIWVDCGGREFETNATMIIQAEFMAEMARALPKFMTVKGDGFLPALIEHGDHDVTHITQDIHDLLYGVNPQQEQETNHASQ